MLVQRLFILPTLLLVLPAVLVLPTFTSAVTSDKEEIEIANQHEQPKQEQLPKQRRRRRRLWPRTRRLKRRPKRRRKQLAVVLPLPAIHHHHKGRRPSSSSSWPPLKFVRRLFLSLSRHGLLFSSSFRTSNNNDNNNYENDNNNNYEYNEFYQPKLAFEMAVLSNLSYWKFHKRPAPNNANGFSLKEQDKDIDTDTEQYTSSFLLKNTWCWLSRAIKESHPITSTTLALVVPIENENTRNKYSKKNKKEPPPYPPARYYSFEYFFYNWHEPTSVKGVSFHDTSVLVSTATISASGDNGNNPSSSTSKKRKNKSNSDTPNNPNTLIITFTGTASVANYITDVQTFVPANHSRFFEPPSELFAQQQQRSGSSTTSNFTSTGSSSSSTIIQGSLHRGFLNAYSKVQRGSVLRLGSSPKSAYTTGGGDSPILEGLHRRFGHCTSRAAITSKNENEHNKNDNSKEEEDHDDSTRNTSPTSAPTGNGKKKKRRRRSDTTANNSNDNQHQKSSKRKAAVDTRGGCRVTDKGTGGEPQVHLSIILKELVDEALSNGYAVHITGHSLGGALASLLALDVLVNAHTNKSNSYSHNKRQKSFRKSRKKQHKHIDDNNTSNDNERLHLWTFGAPQIADTLFLESVVRHSVRLRDFLGIGGDEFECESWKQHSNAIGRYFKNRKRRRREQQRRHHLWRRKKRFHRYVTLSDDGKADVVSELAKIALETTDDNSNNNKVEQRRQQHTITTTVEDRFGSAAENREGIVLCKNEKETAATISTDTTTPSTTKKRKKWRAGRYFYGKVVQSLGGVSRGGQITHFAEPHYLWTPDQHKRQQDQQQQQLQTKQQQQQQQQQQNDDNHMGTNDDDRFLVEYEYGEISNSTPPPTTTTNTRSSVAAHSMSNYLMGISRESGPKNHPLIPNVPTEWLEFMDIAAAIAVASSSTTSSTN